MPTDEVWVAGGGMAGAVAALRARACGASVRLFRRAYGATALSSGAVDVAADLSAPPGSPEPLETDPFAAAAEMARTRPNHPYAVLRASLHRLRESLAFTAEALSELFPVPGDRNLLLPTALGTVKPTALAQWSQVGGDLRTLPSRVAVVQLPHLSQPDARAVALGVGETARALGRGVELHPVWIEGWGRLDDAMRTPVEWANHWEASRAQIDAFAAAVKRALPLGIEAVLLPPIFGRDGSSPMRRLTEALAPLRVAELLAPAPSMPGLRLQAALDRAIARAGIPLVESALERAEAVEAGAVVLATGKYLSGGIVREGGFREPLFDLPVFVEGHPAPGLGQGDSVGRRLETSVEVGHAAFRAGVRIDGALRPLNRALRPEMDRLFAAGSVISGYDPAADKTGLGVALFTGFLAGEQAARSVQVGKGR